MTLPERAQPFAMLLAGFVLWSVVFVALYGVQATGCRLGWHGIEIAGPVTLQRAVLVLMFLGALVSTPCSTVSCAARRRPVSRAPSPFLGAWGRFLGSLHSGRPCSASQAFSGSPPADARVERGQPLGTVQEMLIGLWATAILRLGRHKRHYGR